MDTNDTVEGVDRSRKSVLLIMDTKSLHYSLSSLYGQGARIDFKKLKLMAQNGAGIIRAIAYVGSYKKDSELFLNSLGKLGFEVIFFDKSATPIITEKIMSEVDNYDEIVVTSGTGILNETYRQYPDKFTVAVFPDSLHKETKNYAKIKLLTQEILMPTRIQNREIQEPKFNPLEIEEEVEPVIPGGV